MVTVKIVVEKHPDEGALADVRSAIRFHVETFGPESLGTDTPVLEAFVAEAAV